MNLPLTLLPIRVGHALATALATILVLACGAGPDPATSSATATPEPAAAPAAPAATPPHASAVDARAEAEQVFATRCATCHGNAGAGDGPASAGLTPPPRDFQDPAWQASVSDDHIRQIIQYGGAAVGRSPAMPANPDLTGKPEVVEALRAHVRSLAGG
jgi:mono/diheme cytochrome c family protein